MLSKLSSLFRKNAQPDFITISLDRGSVCMGDDVFSHWREFTIPKDITVRQFFQFLTRQHYIPSVVGDHAVWVLIHRGSELAAYFLETGSVTYGENRLQTVIEETGDHHFFLIYHSRPEDYFNRKKHT